MIDSLVDNFIKYASVYSQALKRYAALYGKDATYLKLPDNSTADPYLVALGKNKVSFDYANPIIKKVPTKIIADYADLYRKYTSEMMDVYLYFSMDAPVVTSGDLVMFTKTGKDILIYRINEATETYADLLYRCNLHLVQNKHVTLGRIGEKIEPESEEHESETNTEDSNNTGVIA